jgi:hypothetical protein
MFHRNNAYDLMRGIILFISCLVLQRLEISWVYHHIRGQVSHYADHSSGYADRSSMRVFLGIRVGVYGCFRLYGAGGSCRLRGVSLHRGPNQSRSRRQGL